MAKPLRSPLLGYNHNVKYRGRVFHVQTEDSGPTNPHLFTHLYFEGTILATKRHVYEAVAPEDQVRALMQGQHKAILKELKQGLHDPRLENFFASRGEPFGADALVDEPETAPIPAAAPAERPLDLDALPPLPAPLPPPEAMPGVTPAANVPGPGVYAAKPQSRERPFPNGVTRIPTPAGVDAPPPAVGRPRTPTQRLTAVSVQRQVVVGVGGPGQGGAARPKRPSPPIPYVVKEGSHPTASSGGVPRPPVPPPRPLVPPTPSAASAPRTTGTVPTAPRTPPGELISDKSLDEVILAYLSQGEPK